MNANTAIKLLVVVLVLGLGGLFLLLGQGDDLEGPQRGTAPVPVIAQEPSELDPATVDEPEVKPTERVEASTSFAKSVLSPWHGELAGLTGRVVEADGTPVVGIRVALLEFDMEMLFNAPMPDADMEEPSLQLEETVTDAEGRFVLGGARAPSIHGLGVDMGGPRSTLRVLDSALIHKQRTDVGDVVLAPYGILTGRVVDEAGAGVAGARIRVGPFPEEVLMGAPHELRGDSMISVSMMLAGGDGQGIIELPRFVRGFVDNLPVPTTTTAEDGSFRLEGVPLSQIIGGVDKQGYAGIPLGPIDMAAAGEQDLGSLVLTRGRTIEGIVEDASGDPIVGIDVYAGAEVPAGFVAILQPCGKTDEDGAFSLRGVPGDGRVVAATRRSESEPWISEVSLQHDDMLLSLETAIQLTVRVNNEAGEPLSGARIRLKPAPKGMGSFGLGEVFMLAAPAMMSIEGFREVEAGVYVNPELTPGSYDVLVSVQGLAPGTASADLWEEESEVIVTCPTGAQLELTVLDAATQEPVERAVASVLEASQAGFARVAGGRTNAAGRLKLGPVGDPPQKGEGFMPAETMLLVRHPSFADHSMVLETTAGEVFVSLQSGGAVAGKVHWDGEIPDRLYMLILEYRGADGFLEIFHIPRFGLTDLVGDFRFDNLEAGEYRVELFERFLDQDPTRLFEGFEPMRLYRETVTVAAGETAELDINLTATGRGPTARIKGRVRVDGREIEGATVVVGGNGNVTTTTDFSGRFETEDFSVFGSVWVEIEGEVSIAGGPPQRMQLFQESMELTAGEVREIDVDLIPIALQVQVTEIGTGTPVSGAWVRARPNKGGSSLAMMNEKGFLTNELGEATVWLPGAGDYSLSTGQDGYSNASLGTKVEDGVTPDPVALEIARSVPCAGYVRVPQGSTGQSFSYVMVRSENNQHQNGVMINGPDFEFELDGLAPGSYKAWVYIDGVVSQESSFELGPDGDTDVVLDYVPGEE